MQDEQQFNQLMLQYNQLKNGAEEIRKAIEKKDYNSAINLIKSREPVFLNCKCIRRYLELTSAQENELNSVLNELRELETANIESLKKSMAQVKAELKNISKNQKIQQAYDFDEDYKGRIINLIE